MFQQIATIELEDTDAVDTASLQMADEDREIHRTLIGIARVRMELDARQLGLLERAKARSLHRKRGHATFVEYIEFQETGGTHEMSNLTLLCSGHHSLLHHGTLSITGRAPDEIGGTTMTPRRPRTPPVFAS